MSAIDELPPLRDVIRRHELSAQKSLGQNFLLDLNLTARIARGSGDLEARRWWRSARPRRPHPRAAGAGRGAVVAVSATAAASPRWRRWRRPIRAVLK